MKKFDEIYCKMLLHRKKQKEFEDSFYVACPYSFELIKHKDCQGKCKNCWLQKNYYRTKNIKIIVGE